MNTLLLVAVSILLLAALGVAGVATRRILNDGGRLRLREAMELAGCALPQPQDRQEATAVGHAARRCATCTAHVQCDLLLAQQDWKALRTFCPNRTYVEGLLRRGPAPT